MKKINLLILSLLSCVASFADQRGATFEKDGLEYTIVSEYIIKENDRFYSDTLFYIRNRGDVYVSGCTASDINITIPTTVEFPTTYCRNKEVIGRYNVVGIGEKAFENASLNKLTIPYGLRFYGKQAFHNLEIKSGILVMPPAMRMKANVFDGLKAKLMITNFEFSQNRPVIFEKTFNNPDLLPDIYVYYGIFSQYMESLDKTNLYTIGYNICKKWLETYSLPKDEYTSCSLRDKINNPGGLISFSTLGLKKGARITIRVAKNYDKRKTDIDMLPPYEYICYNPYTNKRDICQDFVMNKSIFRYRKGEDYFYFTLDGKPLTDKLSLLDSDGKDPFGLQVMNKEDIKAKKEAKEREINLNRKVNDLKRILGF